MKIRGSTVGTTMPRPDWNQTDPKKADYIRNKPGVTPESHTGFVCAAGNYNTGEVLYERSENDPRSYIEFNFTTQGARIRVYTKDGGKPSSNYYYGNTTSVKTLTKRWEVNDEFHTFVVEGNEDGYITVHSAYSDMSNIKISERVTDVDRYTAPLAGVSGEVSFTTGEYKVLKKVLDYQFKAGLSYSVETVYSPLTELPTEEDGEIIENDTVVEYFDLGVMDGSSYIPLVKSYGSDTLKIAPTIDADGLYMRILTTEIEGKRQIDAKFTVTAIPYTMLAVEELYQGKPLNSDILYLNDEKEFLNKFRQAARLPRTPFNIPGTADALNIKPLVLAHFSDIHADGANLQRIISFCDRYSAYIDDILCGGDMVYDYPGDGRGDAWTDISGAEKILVTAGNHDYKGSDGAYSNTPDYVHETFFGGKASWGAAFPGDVNYYYKDYADSKVRLVVLDYFDWGDTQAAWLEAVLNEAKDQGHHIIISTHYTIGDFNDFDTDKGAVRPLVPVDCTFHSLIAKKKSTIFHKAAVDLVQSFIDAGGNFVCWLTGHAHTDWFGTLKEDITDSENPMHYSGQLNVSIDCACANGGAIVCDTERVIGEKSQDLFNIVSIDTYYKTLKIFRVGANYDSWMRKKDSICWDYGNGKLLYN